MFVFSWITIPRVPKISLIGWGAALFFTYLLSWSLVGSGWEDIAAYKPVHIICLASVAVFFTGAGLYHCRDQYKLTIIMLLFAEMFVLALMAPASMGELGGRIIQVHFMMHPMVVIAFGLALPFVLSQQEYRFLLALIMIQILLVAALECVVRFGPSSAVLNLGLPFVEDETLAGRVPSLMQQKFNHILLFGALPALAWFVTGELRTHVRIGVRGLALCLALVLLGSLRARAGLYMVFISLGFIVWYRYPKQTVTVLVSSSVMTLVSLWCVYRAEFYEFALDLSGRPQIWVNHLEDIFSLPQLLTGQPEKYQFARLKFGNEFLNFAYQFGAVGIAIVIFHLTILVGVLQRELTVMSTRLLPLIGLVLAVVTALSVNGDITGAVSVGGPLFWFLVGAVTKFGAMQDKVQLESTATELHQATS